MWHPTMESFAKKMLQVSNIRPSYVNWNYFPDTWPNITFEPSATLVNKDIIFIMSIAVKEIFAEQLAMLVALPRQLVNSLTIVVPYLGPATHERVDYSGQLATVEPILKILSSCIPMTKTGPPILRIFDIHALQIRFYTNDNVTMKLMSAVPVLLEYLKSKPRTVIAYPDDGSYKRFKYFFEDFPQVICSKIRDGNARKIIIREYVNWPEEAMREVDLGNTFTQLTDVLIIDDLVQSGETLISCAAALKKFGFTSVSAYVTHAVFPNDAWKKFVGTGVITEFIITNTNPTVSDKLDGIRPFVVLDVQTHLCTQLKLHNPNVQVTPTKPIENVYVATTNVAKLTAVYEATLQETSIFPNDRIYEVYSVEGIRSEIPEQPVSLTETSDGALNRLNNCMYIVHNRGIFVAIENGLYVNDNNDYCDVPVIQYKFPNEEIKMVNSASSAVIIPESYREHIEEALNSPGRSITFGSILEKKLAIKDWHKFISGRSRKDLIRDCFQKPLYPLCPDPEPEQGNTVVKKSNTFAVLTKKFNQLGAFIDTKINEVKA